VLDQSHDRFPVVGDVVFAHGRGCCDASLAHLGSSMAAAQEPNYTRVSRGCWPQSRSAKQLLQKIARLALSLSETLGTAAEIPHGRRPAFPAVSADRPIGYALRRIFHEQLS